MRFPLRPGTVRLFLIAAGIALPLAGASSCNRKAGGPAGSGTPTAVPAVQYTPRPIPPTATLPPGAPTRKPSLPG